jgi:hypothetical protein
MEFEKLVAFDIPVVAADILVKDGIIGEQFIQNLG